MYNVVDLFAGGGGFSRGFAEAGFKIIIGVEIDPNAARTFSYNFPHAVVLEEDVSQISYREIEKYGRPDIVIGGSPCEPFTSTNPNRMEDPLDRLYTDPLGQLTLHFIRLVGELQPKVFVLENVPGLARGPLKEAIRREFKRVGFDEIYFNKLLAERYGTPSHRERVFISNVEIKPPRAAPRVVREALAGLPPVDSGFPNHETVTISQRKAERIARLKPGDALMRFRGAEGFYENYIRLKWDEIAPTVMGSRRFVHPEENRLLTVREQARLMGFPDDHVFFGPKDSQFNQVGEAVPPTLSYAIALALRRSLG
ncbi:MAG: DNA cytosine methyltransferase [Thermoproteus sp. AZ2]|uniref:DNA cytosine methyltransferase n=1 Tax=Thermoproteus sp. AZ2 TaxID=1609232 RepID=A0ACC6V1M8_9CREN|nr:MAG: modification methylase [Thermoproteus sp. AZ2]